MLRTEADVCVGSHVEGNMHPSHRLLYSGDVKKVAAFQFKVM